MPHMQALQRPVWQKGADLVAAQLLGQAAELDPEAAAGQLREGPPGQAAERIDHAALEHRCAERRAEPVEVARERAALDLRQGRAPEREGRVAAFAAGLEVEISRLVDAGQQVAAVVGEALFGPLVEPAIGEEVGGIACGPAAGRILDLDRQREQGCRAHGDHAESERHARKNVADTGGGVHDLELDRHARLRERVRPRTGRQARGSPSKS